MLELKVGEYYTCRNGTKARVEYIAPTESGFYWPVIVSYESSKQWKHIHLNGSVSSSDEPAFNSAYDLVGPWKDYDIVRLPTFLVIDLSGFLYGPYYDYDEAKKVADDVGGVLNILNIDTPKRRGE